MVLVCLLLLFVPVSQPQRVTFQKGTSSTAISGSVKGYQLAEYILRASEGQTMSVKLSSANPHVVFSIFDGQGRHFQGSPAETTEWSGRLPASDDYIIVTGLTRAAARRTKRPVKFTLHISIR